MWARAVVEATAVTGCRSANVELLSVYRSSVPVAEVAVDSARGWHTSEWCSQADVGNEGKGGKKEQHVDYRIDNVAGSEKVETVYSIVQS